MPRHASTPRSDAPPAAPDVYRADAEGLRAFAWDHVRRGAFVALVRWLVDFVTRLWKIQGDLLERQRAHARRHAPSERLRALQAVLPGLFASPDNDAPPPAKRTRAKRGARTPTPHGRAKFPPTLARVATTVAVPDAARRCARCTTPLTVLGYETSEKLERIPERYVVVQTRREKLACPCCRDVIVTAEKPDEIVDRGALGEDLRVHAMVDHYVDAVPFERLARNARAHGAPLAANTLARGVARLVDLLDPVVRHIFARCVGSHVVGTDATSLPVLDAALPAGLRRGALWNLLGDERWSYFGYAPSGHDAHLAALLHDVTLDVLQCDGSATINVLEAKARVRAGCHAHARAKLAAAARAGDPRAVEGLRLYAALFAIEAQAKSAGDSPAQRHERRARESRDVIARLRVWVETRSRDVEPRCPLGRAVGYLRRQWKRLIVFLDDGHIALTNHGVERQLRTWVLDRKTWLFCGHDASAARAAAALTVLMTCQRLGVEPRAYVRDTVRKLLAGTRDAAALWPENYVPTP